MNAAELVDLSALEQIRPAALDPATWLGNLEALRESQPDVAARVERAVLPAAWIPAAGLDGFLTWRVEERAAAPAWLSGSASPQVRAAGLLATYHGGEGNVALPTVASGAEAALLLARLPAHRAVLVFESDEAQLRAVLQTQQFGDAIRAGRLYFVDRTSDGRALEALLAAHVGLLPPAQLVGAGLVPPPLLNALSAMLESVALSVTSARNDLLRNRSTNCGPQQNGPQRNGPQQSGPQPPSAAFPDRPSHDPTAALATESQTPRLAIISSSPDPDAAMAARAMARAAGELGWGATACCADAPRRVGALATARELDDFSPAIHLFLNDAAIADALVPARKSFVFLADANRIPQSFRSDCTYLLASPEIARRARQIAPPGARLREWYWAVEESPPSPADRARESAASVWIVADLPADDAAGIDQPTHQQLWRAAAQAAARGAGRGELRSAALLAEAQRVCRLELADAVLRERMLGAIAERVIPAALLRASAERLRAGRVVGVVGAGWEPWLAAATRRTVGDQGVCRPALIADSWRTAPWRDTPACFVFLDGGDPLHPALLTAALHGRVVILCESASRLNDRLGGVLCAPEHVAAVTSPENLPESLLASASIVAPARKHLLANHTWPRRLSRIISEI